MTRMHAGFTGVVPDEWPMPRGWTAPERLGSLGVETLARRRCRTRAGGCARSGSRRSRDLLLHRPRRYEQAVDEIAISQLWGDEEVAIAGEVVDVRTRRLGGRRTDRDGACQRRQRHDRRVVVQPALARGEADARHALAAARKARPLRLRREELRRGRGARDGGLRAGLSRQRAGAVDEAARARRGSALAVRALPAAIRCRRGSTCRCAATRSWPSTSRRPKPRPRRRGDASRSTSCLRSNWSSRARVTTTRLPARCPLLVSLSGATATCCPSS